MPSALITTTLQAASLAALSNILAQMISTFQADKPFSFDFAPFVQFVVWALISTPPNLYWQMFLEEKFPSNKTDQRGEKRLSKSNTLKKFLLDQTIGGTLNTAAFIAGISAFKGLNMDDTFAAVLRDFWPLMSSGLKLWPAVSLLNFTVVPANSRILVGNTVGLFWGIYLSLMTAV